MNPYDSGFIFMLTQMRIISKMSIASLTAVCIQLLMLFVVAIALGVKQWDNALDCI